MRSTYQGEGDYVGQHLQTLTDVALIVAAFSLSI